MLEGRCSCGAVRFRCDGPLVSFGHCHCSMCRKHHGASFVTWMVARSSSFAWTSGEEDVARYGASEHFDRCWCPDCGSTVPMVHGSTVDGESGFFAGAVDIPAGSVVTPVEQRPTYHIFAASKAPWVEITDGLPVHHGWRDPEKSPPEVEGPARAIRPGCVTGSCLCGEVVFEVETPREGDTSDAPMFSAMRNCHCRRCRLARGAAHATNLFAPSERVRFVRGADRVVEYALPEAERFGVAFCAGCGSHVARVVRGRPYAVIPAGALDQDPGIRPSDHIFVGSKADWFEITDDLPQHEEYPPAG